MGESRTTRGLRGACPNCGQAQECATDPDGDAVPKPGDVAVCIRCASVSIFEHGGERREPTEAELFALLADPDVVKLRAAIRRALEKEKGEHGRT